MAKTYIYNPTDGAPITNWYDGHSYWSIAVDEVKNLPPDVAKRLKATYGFLVEITQEEAESMLARVEETIKSPAPNKVVGGEIVVKTEDEIVQEIAAAQTKKGFLKKLLAKIKKSSEDESKPAQPKYEDLSRGLLLSEAIKRNLDLKAFGKTKITKEQVISMLRNNDIEAK